MREDEKRIDYLKYFNTALLTIIAIVAILIFDTVSGVKALQTEQGKELIRIKTVQDINTGNIGNLQTRVSYLEKDNIQTLQTWVDNNYIRKPQTQ